jgi:hypothetical protein
MAARKKRKKKFRAVTAVKEAAREAIGTPPPTRTEEPKTNKQREKHKPTFGKLLSGDEPV